MSFWRSTPLSEMSDQQWESLCDGCGKCCLHKLEDADTGDLYVTNVACRLLDLKTARCARYGERKRIVANCMDLRSDLERAARWLPDTCAYRLLHEGADLPTWHPLNTGRADTVAEAGMSVIGIAISEKLAGDYEDHIIGDDDEVDADDNPSETGTDTEATHSGS